MWVVMHVITKGWYCREINALGFWPNSSPAPDGFVSEGTAITMCDVLNARDYPEQFSKELTNVGSETEWNATQVVVRYKVS